MSKHRGHIGKVHVSAAAGIRRNAPSVHSFRGLDDARSLTGRLARSQRVVVLGGGLLRLKTARALRRHGTKVVLVYKDSRHHALWRRERSDELPAGSRVSCAASTRERPAALTQRTACCHISVQTNGPRTGRSGLYAKRTSFHAL